MIATMGGQPQVVTFALDFLLARQFTISELLVLHLTEPAARVQAALDKLAIEFRDGFYQGKRLRYRPYPVGLARPLPDIYDESDADAAWEAVHDLIARLKAERHTLHVCISGGRRILGLLTMSAAMLHFGHQDTLWHMYTPNDIRLQAQAGVIMHLPAGSGFRLIRVPMMPWGTYFPALRELSQPIRPGDVLASARAVMDAAEEKRCRSVIKRLTDRQLDVLRAFAQGLSPQRVAAQLHISIRTVDSHKTVILAECRNAWELPPDARLDYRFLAEKFEMFSW